MKLDDEFKQFHEYIVVSLCEMGCFICFISLLFCINIYLNLMWFSLDLEICHLYFILPEPVHAQRH